MEEFPLDSHYLTLPLYTHIPFPTTRHLQKDLDLLPTNGTPPSPRPQVLGASFAETHVFAREDHYVGSVDQTDGALLSSGALVVLAEDLLENEHFAIGLQFLVLDEKGDFPFGIALFVVDICVEPRLRC